MKLLEQYQGWKERYDHYLILCRCGNFYDIFHEDTKILAYLMNYKINEYNGIKKLGFPVVSLSKVLRELEKSRINYLVFEKIEDQYQITIKKRFINNQYDVVKSHVEDYSSLKAELEDVYQLLKSRLLEPDFSELLIKVRALL